MKLRIIAIYGLIFLGLFMLTNYHEVSHQNIFLTHGCINVSDIEYEIRGGWVFASVKCLGWDEDVTYEELMQANLLHQQNDIVGYHVFGALTLLILVSLPILLMRRG